MILTCPACATRYFVDDGKIGAAGRAVKCASCGHRWRVEAEAAELELDAAPAAPKAEALPVSELPGEALPKVFRARADSERRMKEAAVAGVVWAAMAVFLGLLIGAAVIFRVDMVRLWPRTAGAYAAIGLPVNAVGVAIENIAADSILQDGRAVLRVTGTLRNIQDQPITPPPVQVSLIDAQGKPVAARSAPPGRTPLAPGATRPFSIAILDPPSSGKDLEVAFVLGKQRPPPVAATEIAPPKSTVARGPGLRGAADPENAGPPATTEALPAEAAPLPAGSPFALEPPPAEPSDPPHG